MYGIHFRMYTPYLVLLSEIILMLTTKAYCATTTTVTATTPSKKTTPVTTNQPHLGSDCSGKEVNWCNDNVALNSTCGPGDTCVCDAATSFKFNSTTCLQLHFLKPLSPRIEDISPSEINISWMKASEVFSLQNIWFNVNLASQDESRNISCGDTNSTTVECSNLTPGHKYKVTVLAKSGNASQSVSMTNSTRPSRPGELNTTGVFDAPDVKLRWQNATGRVDYYIVKILQTGKSFNSTNASSEVMATELEPGTMYNISIKAFSYHKPGPRRKEYFSTTKNSHFGKPENLTVESYDTTAVTLDWEKPTELSIDKIAGYRVRHRYQLYPNSSLSLWTNTKLSPSDESITIQNLIPGAYYHFQVYTIKDGNTSYAFAEIRQQTSETLPGAVRDLNVISDIESLLVHWKRPDHPNGCITHYLVKWGEEGKDACDMCVFNYTLQQTDFCGNSSGIPSKVNVSHKIEELKGNTTYNVTVQVFNRVGGGSPKAIVKTTFPTPPNPIHDITVTNVTTSSITVTWNVTSDDSFTFKVCLDDLFLNQTCPSSCQENDSFCVIDDLKAYREYRVSVHAFGSVNFTKEKKDNIRTRPSIPGQVDGCNVATYASDNKDACDASRATVMWQAPDRTESNSLITHYRLTFVERNTVIITDNTERRNFSYTFSNIPANSSHTIKIRAVSKNTTEGILEGKWYNVTFKTGICAPPEWPSSKMESVSATTSGITLSMSSRFFKNKSQGEILMKGVIVSQEKNIQVPVLSIGSYSSSKSQRFREPYRIDLTASMDKRKMEISIGDEAGCRLQPYCNGPLPEKFSFHVTAFACTGTKDALCRLSRSFGPFKTSYNAPEESSPSALIIVTVVLLVAVIFLTCVVLWRKGIIDPTRIFSKSVEIEQQPLEKKREHYTEIQRKRPIMLSEFEYVLSDLHKDSNLKFSDQYEDILKLSKIIETKSKFDEAIKEENKPKNRWVNILPFDHSRVKLQQLDDDDPSTDYINANYIPGYHHRREYIATQGPLPGTVEDFWRMVWEQNAAVIVMLTKCKEGNRVKCEQYWPSELREPKQYWNVVVNLISISALDKFNLSIFNLTMNKEKRQVMHFHYQDFPDFSANVEMDNFIEFTRTVRNHVPHELRGPLIVHCSAGVGRSGTYIAIDRLLQFLNDPDFSLDLYVDIFDIVMSMRENRVTMVQTESQFVMVFDCFQKMLEEKKREILANISIDSDDKLYANQGFEPYPEVVYENIANREPHLQLVDDEFQELQTAL